MHSHLDQPHRNPSRPISVVALLTTIAICGGLGFLVAGVVTYDFTVFRYPSEQGPLLIGVFAPLGFVVGCGLGGGLYFAAWLGRRLLDR